MVDDSSIPSLNQQSIEQLPSSTIEGESLTLSIDAIDAYDQSYQLVYHWDLNPSSDSDANGDPTDDPDYIGSSVDVKFDQGGRKDIVVTVFDQSGNSDSHAFSINVDNAVEPTSAVGLVMVAMFVGVITISVAMIGFRRWQAGIAVQLLQGRGLSEAEAKQHIAMVKQRTKIPIFADASVIAGLDSGQQIVTSEQKSQQRQDAEYQSIYGNSSNQSQASESFAPPTNMYAPSGFAPTQSQYGMGTQSAAADAMAMFAEEENEEIIETNKQEGVIEKVTKVISGGIELPHQVKSQIEVNDMEEDQHLSVESTEDFSTENQNVQQVSCPLCSSNFKIEIPDVDEAIVECPTCNQDFMLRFD